MDDNLTNQDEPSLSPEYQKIVDRASDVVWRVERGFVRKRLTRQLPALNGKRYNEIMMRGVDSIAFDLAGAFWAVVAWCVFVLMIFPQTLVTSTTALRYGGWTIVVTLFLLAIFRLILARRSSSKYQEHRK